MDDRAGPEYGTPTAHVDFSGPLLLKLGTELDAIRETVGTLPVTASRRM
jgi:hypothetical protein